MRGKPSGFSLRPTNCSTRGWRILISAVRTLSLKAFPQADSEFDRCVTRRGEALSLLVDEQPTSGYFPLALYHQGVAREGLNDPGFRKAYEEYLSIRGNSSEDFLVPQIRKRLGTP